MILNYKIKLEHAFAQVYNKSYLTITLLDYDLAEQVSVLISLDSSNVKTLDISMLYVLTMV